MGCNEKVVLFYQLLIFWLQAAGFSSNAEEMFTAFKFHRMKDINDWGIFRRLCHEHALMINKILGFPRSASGIISFF